MGNVVWSCFFKVTILVGLFIIEAYPFTLIYGHMKEENKFYWTTSNLHIPKECHEKEMIFISTFKNLYIKIISVHNLFLNHREKFNGRNFRDNLV